MVFSFYLAGIELCTITSLKTMMRLSLVKVTLFLSWKNVMTDGLLEHPKEPEFSEHFPEIMWPKLKKFKQISTTKKNLRKKNWLSHDDKFSVSVW